MSSLEPSERGDLPPASYDSSSVQTAVAVPAPPRDRVWLHLLLLILTFCTTTLAGAIFYQSFATNVGLRPVRIPTSSLLLNALWFSVTALTILGAHEMGHYVACKYYGISASLPYFIPFLPGISPFGTLGAVIRIREPIRTKRMLFDIGVAGPIAGFVVLVPAILLGMSWSRLVHLPPHLPGGWEFGEPLLFKLAERLFFGGIPQGYDVNLHPMGWAAWLGMLATALNLLPVGQLDGGHIMYANFGKRANIVSYVTLAILLLIGVRGSTNWLIWGGLLVLLMYLFGWQHPPTQDEERPLDTNRILVSLFAIVMFVLCFTPVPITPAR